MEMKIQNPPQKQLVLSGFQYRSDSVKAVRSLNSSEQIATFIGSFGVFSFYQCEQIVSWKMLTAHLTTKFCNKLQEPAEEPEETLGAF